MHSNVAVAWIASVSRSLDLKVPCGTVSFTQDKSSSFVTPIQVTSLDTKASANLATITIPNVVSENNHSTVQCIDTIMGTKESSARNIVEGKGSKTTLCMHE